MGSLIRVQVGLVETSTVFGINVNCFLSLRFFNRTRYFACRELPYNNDPGEKFLCDQNHADVSVMAAFRKQVTHLLGIDVVQQIVEDHEARSAARVFKICRDTLL